MKSTEILNRIAIADNQLATMLVSGDNVIKLGKARMILQSVFDDLKKETGEAEVADNK